MSLATSSATHAVVSSPLAVAAVRVEAPLMAAKKPLKKKIIKKPVKKVVEKVVKKPIKRVVKKPVKKSGGGGGLGGLFGPQAQAKKPIKKVVRKPIKKFNKKAPTKTGGASKEIGKIANFAGGAISGYGGGNGAALFTPPVAAGIVLWGLVLLRYVLFYGFFE